MGRFLMYTTLLVLALFVASSYLILEHGGGTIAAVQDVTVHDLTLRPTSYDGQPVTTSGTLNHNEDLGLWELIEEDANFAVVIRNFEDETLLESLDGKRVRVHGVFGSDTEIGTYINADSVHEVAD